jgi:hypothetical protein
MDLLLLEEKLLETKLSFNRQLSLSGNPGYDPQLTFDLKRDIKWFEQQKSFYEHEQPEQKA